MYLQSYVSCPKVQESDRVLPLLSAAPAPLADTGAECGCFFRRYSAIPPAIQSLTSCHPKVGEKNSWATNCKRWDGLGKIKVKFKCLRGTHFPLVCQKRCLWPAVAFIRSYYDAYIFLEHVHMLFYFSSRRRIRRTGCKIHSDFNGDFNFCLLILTCLFSYIDFQ